MLTAQDCTKEEKLCSDNGVKGYPTIKYYKDGDKVSDPSYRSGEAHGFYWYT